MTIAELKAQLSKVLEQMLKSGELVAISYGKRKIAALVPYLKTAHMPGLMKGRARCVVHDDSALSDEELLRA